MKGPFRKRAEEAAERGLDLSGGLEKKKRDQGRMLGSGEWYKWFTTTL